MSRTIHDLSVWNKPLIHTYQYCSTSRANHALRSLANAGFQNRRACLQAFPSFPSPFFHFLALVSFSARSKPKISFLCLFFAPKLNGNASYAGYATLLTKGANPLPHAGSLTKIVTFFFRKLKISRVGPAGSPKTSPRAWKIACKYHHGERRKIKWIKTQHPLHCKL